MYNILYILYNFCTKYRDINICPQLPPILFIKNSQKLLLNVSYLYFKIISLNIVRQGYSIKSYSLKKAGA